MINMRFFNTETNYCQMWPPNKCLAIAYQDKIRKYIDSCIQQQRHFSPFVASVNGLLGVEPETTLKRMVSRLATKLKTTLLTYMFICPE